MFSKACNYAIRALIFVCHSSDQGQRVGIKAIASQISSPEAFTAKILQQLSRKKLLMSVKGPNGGFFVDEAQRQATLYQIVAAIDGDELMTGCALGFSACSENRPCPIHDSYKGIKNQFIEMLHNTLLADLGAGVTEGLFFLDNK